ncbi:hypothetical protein Glove_25g43 [Diversispora epigaea]|uniref:Protein kinase domain-containing protein n=1 Tax=Diversispora epigaea TaxID=1348612 RepID=A0A397JJS3_9GLOM|nr:hypothetical protein Glove_25g43 [Diversispora epigaea]
MQLKAYFHEKYLIIYILNEDRKEIKNQVNKKWQYAPNAIKNDFDKWTSGNDTIDKFIQDSQLNANYRFGVIEWIPYDRLEYIKQIAKDRKEIKNQVNKKWQYAPNAIKNDFDKWTSGNDTIDKFIQDSQLNANYRFGVIEWIPYDRLEYIKQIAKGGLGRYIKWKKKLHYLRGLADKLKTIHGSAPEVLSGEEYTKAADVYSFGIITCEMITGIPPYHDIPHNKDLAMKICNGLRPKIPFHTPKLITRMIMRCWDAQVTRQPTFVTNMTATTSLDYKTHPQAIYTSRLLNFSSLPKPKNDENFEKKLDELTKSISDLSTTDSGVIDLDMSNFN